MPQTLAEIENEYRLAQRVANLANSKEAALGLSADGVFCLSRT